MFRCLTIAGSDSSGGAGIQADLKVFYELGCFGSCAISCVTAQNTYSISSILPLSADFVAKQIEAVLDDIGTDCIKLGMLLNKEIIEIVYNRLSYYKPRLNFKLVIDPVMVAKSGVCLLDPEAIECFKNKLFPLADIITPNLPEASTLLNNTINNEAQMRESAHAFLKIGLPAVIIKGGHLSTDFANDIICYKEDDIIKEKWLYAKRIKTKNTHGTGCSFSAALCAHLARGNDLLTASVQAKNFITNSLINGEKYKIGNGFGPAFI